MKSLRVVSLLSALWSLAGIANAEALKLKMGAGTADGTVSFTLNSGSDSIDIEVALGPMSAAAKATAVKNAVAAQDASGTWSAEATGTSLTFQHLVEDTWQAVTSISDLQDTTGGGNQLKTKNAALVFSLGMNGNAVATGVDAAGNPSFITVTVTDSLTWTRAIQAGDTPQGLLDLFSAFLADQAEDSVGIVHDTPAVIVLSQTSDGDTLSLNWQVTDTGLLAGVHGSANFGSIDR